MEDIGDNIEFSDWPEQHVDLSGSNPWLPAYGFLPPQTHLNKDDFFGNPDGELFLQGGCGTSYVYLETIQEETSDDLQSADNVSEAPSSITSSVATEIESSTQIIIDDVDNESDREVACPKKRRRHENNLTVDDDDESLSRSSSLLQFENLEKQCQDIAYTSPCVYTNYTYDSLERKSSVSPDSLENTHSDNEAESDYYKTFKIDIHTKKRSNFMYKSDYYNCDKSDSESADSEETLEAVQFGSNSHLKTWRSLDGLAVHNTKTVKISTENLSEDSGYSDHLNKSSSISNIMIQHDNKRIYKTCTKIGNYSQLNNCKISNSGFGAYDGDVFNKFTTTFGVSLHDLSSTDKYERNRTQLIDRFLRNGAAKRRYTVGIQTPTDTNIINIEKVSECLSKYNYNSASEPNLLSNIAGAAAFTKKTSQSEISNKQSYFENSVCISSEPSVSSVPKNLNLIGELKNTENKWGVHINTTNQSIATKNCDIHDLSQPYEQKIYTNNDTQSNMPKLSRYHRAEYGDKITIRLKYDSSSISSTSDNEISHHSSFKREGSYAEAMRNVIESEQEQATKQEQKTKHKRTIAELDRLKAISESSLKAISETSLKAISETSVQSTGHENTCTSTPILKSDRNVISTPNLACYDNEYYHNDDFDDNIEQNVEIKAKKSLTGSSKGVHFYPVVQEMNWLDRGYSAERESTVSLTSNSDDELPQRQCFVNNTATKQEVTQISVSQPDLRMNKRYVKKHDNYSDTKFRLKKLNGFVNSKDEIDNILLDSNEDIMENRAIPLDTLLANCKFPPSNDKIIDVRQRNDVGNAREINSEKRSMDTAHNRVWRSSNDVTVAAKCTDTMSNCADMTSSLTHVSDVYVSPTNSISTSASASNKHFLELDRRGNADTKTKLTVQAMDSPVTRRVHPQPVRSTNKIGGFFSRIASFRFSTRKKDDKNKQKEKKSVEKQIDRTGQRIATKEDYIYIPLKGDVAVPGNATINNKFEVIEKVCAKPPLPKVPPRVVGASVKKRSAEIDAHSNGAHRGGLYSEHECRTIDSGVVRHLPRPMEPMGLIETDLDTEVTIITSASAHVKTRSLMNLGVEAPTPSLSLSLAAPQQHHQRPHKSMEFLLDKENLKVVEPPENELRKGGERVMSEHQLRVQRSLQKLNVPDWYKQGLVPREGFLLKKKPSARECRWQGTSGGSGSKTTSLSSLGSTNQSPLLLSPTLHAQQPFVRWSTSKLNSTASSPCTSTRSSFNARQTNGSISPSSLRSSFNYRQPYLGWRSQERLSKPRTPAERLANTIITQSNHTNEIVQPNNPEIQSSIKEVTSAIVHYVSGLKPDENMYDDITHRGQRSRSVSPRGSQRLCWLESSFVGTKPLDSPQTPVTLTESHESPVPPTSLRLELQHNGESIHA